MSFDIRDFVILFLCLCSGALVVSAFTWRAHEVLVDQDTGCQYLMTRNGGVTPRLRADGSLFCRGGDKEGAND